MTAPAATWFDYTPESVAEWLAWLEEHPDGAPPDNDDSEVEDEAPAPPAPPLVAVRPSWHGYDAAVVFGAPWVDQPMLIPELDIGQGRPTGLWGQAGAGKNDTIQALALAVMTGRPAFDRFPLGHLPNGGRVVHLTYDMGLASTALRYRRLANGYGIALHELVEADRFLLCVHPPTHLDHPSALKAFTELLTGFDLAILDNARSSAPDTDENDSRFGAVIATFGAAAERAGCTPVYLHHTKKINDDGKAATVDVGRGSTAITASSGCVWLLTGQKADPRRMQQLRLHDSSEGPKDDFYLHREAVAGGSIDVGSHQSWRLIARDSGDAAAGLPERLMRELERAGHPITQHELRRALGGKAAVGGTVLKMTLASLISSGRVTENGGKLGLCKA
jgi:hypothetical protein